MRSSGRTYAVVSYLFLGLFLGLIAYMIYFQFCKSEELLSSPYNARPDEKEEQIVRGSILASDGTVLASTQVDEEGNETRVYPYGSLFAQTVGYSDYGTSGLEASQNHLLLESHETLAEQVQKDLNNEKKSGDSLVTTFNVGLQQACRDALGDRAGAVIVLDAATGNVLADVSTPDFDPNTVSENWDTLTAEDSNSPFLNRPLQGLYAPGSTFKMVTALAYYREYGSLDDFTFTCTGEYTAGNFTIHCSDYEAHGQQSLAQAFANSCNCAFAYMAAELLDNDILRNTAEDLQFNSSLELELPSYDSEFSLESDSAIELSMQTAIGQGDTVATPLEMAMIAQSIYNNGEMYQPNYLLKLQSVTGTLVKEYSGQSLGQVMTPDEAAQLKELMFGVVRAGTATQLSELSCNVAGKTGTAQYGNIEDGTSHSWFVGFSNTGTNDIVVCVLVENGGAGSESAVPAAYSVFQTVFG